MYQEYDKKQSELRALMMEMAKRSNAIVVDPVDHFCEGNQCRAIMDDGRPIYKDSSHIRPFYVKQFIEFLDVTLKK